MDDIDYILCKKGGDVPHLLLYCCALHPIGGICPQPKLGMAHNPRANRMRIQLSLPLMPVPVVVNTNSKMRINKIPLFSKTFASFGQNTSKNEIAFVLYAR